MGRSKLNRRRIVVYAATDMGNSDIVALLEGSNQLDDTYAQQSATENRSAQELSDSDLVMHNNEDKGKIDVHKKESNRLRLELERREIDHAYGPPGATIMPTPHFHTAYTDAQQQAIDIMIQRMDMAQKGMRMPQFVSRLKQL